MKNFNILGKRALIATIAIASLSVSAREKQGNVFKNTTTHKVLAGCSAAQSAAELSINNVRAVVYSGSDMWWDLFGSGNAWYAVPKVDQKSKFVNSPPLANRPALALRFPFALLNYFFFI